MKLNRKWVLVIALLMSVAMATAGTLAYLTDRDSEVNVFTVGNVDIELNEDFVQDSELIPGVDIEKEVKITNIGKNDAWVWVTIAIPSALDDVNDASNNVIHFNYSKDSVVDGQWQWLDEVKTETIDDVEYNVYTVLYQTALKAGEQTATAAMEKVYLDYHIDVDDQGNVYHVENGVVTDLNWNIKTQANPRIHVSAYGIQTEGFATAKDGYDAYSAQWGEKLGHEHAYLEVSTSEELLEAVKLGKSVKLMNDITLTGCMNVEPGRELTIDLNGKTITDPNASMTMYVKAGAKVTITGNGTIVKENHNANMMYFDGELNIVNGTFKYAPYTWGECDTSVAPCNHHGANPLKVGSVLVGRKGTKYAGVLSIYGGTFDTGILNPEDFLSGNSEIKDKSKPVTMYALINSNASQPMEAWVYGGTFIGANPVDGDPNKPYTLYLVGQTEAGTLPDTGYTVTESTVKDGRTAYTYEYNP